MAEFDTAIEAQLSGKTVRLAPLVRFDFVSGTVRLWPGFGPMVLGGQTWQGIGNLGSLEIIEAGPGQGATERTYTLFGDETILAQISEDADEASGREVYDYVQFFQVDEFDQDGNWIDWQPIGDPFQMWWGVMGEIAIDRPQVAPGEMATRSVSVPAVNAFHNRRRPTNSYYTDRDQKARHPGDTIFVAMASARRKIRWPYFST